MTEPERRRRRPAVSCALCRKRKVRCNREQPCSNCIRAKNADCIYESHPPLSLRQDGESRDIRSLDTPKTSTISSQSVTSLENRSTAPSTPGTQPSVHEADRIRDKMKQHEEQLSRVISESALFRAPGSNSRIETHSSSLAGSFSVHHDAPFFCHAQPITRSITHKTRLFGQSHWVNGIILLRDMLELIEPLSRDDSSKIFANLQKCKALARAIKAQRAPPWPCTPNAELPPKHIADELVECYLRTMERMHRVLHIPTFKRDYEALWASDAVPDIAVTVQIKLVLAIGAVVYDDKFSLRTSAIRWIYEAQIWISTPTAKSQLTLQSLQTHILLLLAKDLVNVGGDLIWIATGSVLRMAMYMGMHRDPGRLPKMTPLAAEMRRRLWNTILEISLQGALNAGGPAMISLEDYDTLPPANIDDEQLNEEEISPKPPEIFTKVSVVIALRKALPVRLAVIKFLNNIGSSGTYEETLQLDAQLRGAYRTLRRDLQEYTSEKGATPSSFEIGFLDLIMYRYIAALHIPFFAPALRSTAFAYSRKVVVDISLKMWCTAYPSSTVMSAQAQFQNNPTDQTRNDLSRLVTSGSVFFRTAVFMTAFLGAMELRASLQEEDGFGPIPLRSDLLALIQDTKTWTFRCIEAGETSIKGHLVHCFAATYVDALMRRVNKEDIPRLLIEEAEKAEERCIPILEDMLAQLHPEGTGGMESTSNGFDQMNLNTSVGLMEDWDFMMSDVLFSSGAESMGWGLNAPTAYGTSFL